MNVGQCFNTQPLATSHKYCDTTPFFLKKYAYSPPPPFLPYSMLRECENCFELLWWLPGTSGRPKTLKFNIETGGWKAVCAIRVGDWKSKIILTGIYLSRCFQKFSNKLKNELHPLHTASIGSSNLKRQVIFWFYIAIFIISLELQRVALHT